MWGVKSEKKVWMERNNVYLCGRFRDGGGSAARSAGARGRDRGERRCKKSEVFFAERNKRFIFAVLFRHGAGRRESKFIERLEDKKSTSKYRF